MRFAIITDSTCDLSAAELRELGARRVPLYVRFRDETFRDWEEIGPKEIVEGVQAGAALPTTSQPTPADFGDAYREAADAGAEAVLCLTISAELSGTHQSARLASADSPVPVTLFDSRNASAGLADLVRLASRMREAGAGLDEVVPALERLRDSHMVLFTVASLEFLQKGGRIGRAGALLGGLLNIKPLLTLEDGKLAPLGRARGNKKALRELVGRLEAYAAERGPGAPIVVDFIHVQDPGAADELRAALRETGVEYRDGGTFELGAVIASHVGPGTYGMYVHVDPLG